MILCIINWHHLWKSRISHITISMTKSCMVQTWLITVTSLEIENLSNALERQMQTLSTAVEWLT